MPNGYNTINPFIVSKDALKLIGFLIEVFGAEEDIGSHAVDHDGLLIHSEVMIGNSRVMIADTKPNWPYTPALLQIYVEDVEATLAKSRRIRRTRLLPNQLISFGAFLFSRMKDPFGNLWWVWKHYPEQVKSLDQTGSDSSESALVSPAGEQQYWRKPGQRNDLHLRNAAQSDGKS